MTTHKRILIVSISLLLPFTSQAHPLIGMFGGFVGVTVGATAIAGLTLPSLVSYHAGVKREELQAEVANFKKSLTLNENVIFDQKYKAIDTSIATKAPAVMQVLGCGLVNTARTYNSISYTLSPMGKATQVAALAVACGNEYAEYKNRENFKDTVIAIQSSQINTLQKQ